MDTFLSYGMLGTLLKSEELLYAYHLRNMHPIITFLGNILCIRCLFRGLEKEMKQTPSQINTHIYLCSLPEPLEKDSRGICFLMERRQWLMRYVNRILKHRETIARQSLIQVSASSALLSSSRVENH